MEGGRMRFLTCFWLFKLDCVVTGNTAGFPYHRSFLAIMLYSSHVSQSLLDKIMPFEMLPLGVKNLLFHEIKIKILKLLLEVANCATIFILLPWFLLYFVYGDNLWTKYSFLFLFTFTDFSKKSNFFFSTPKSSLLYFNFESTAKKMLNDTTVHC